jgi:hypothetical protein
MKQIFLAWRYPAVLDKAVEYSFYSAHVLELKRETPGTSQGSQGVLVSRGYMFNFP